MLKDRDQKQKALRYAAAKRWFPQLEVDVRPTQQLGKKVTPVTDLDVLACIPDDFRGFRLVVFDCKTKAKESAVNRSLWLRGVLDRVRAEVGICIMRKNAIEPDHKLMATSLDIILLAENEFDLYANATSEHYCNTDAHIADIESWERLYSIGARYPKLNPAMEFGRSTYWMLEDAFSSCRRTLAHLREVRAELDPAKTDHVGVVCDFAALFARSIAVLCSYLFKAYLHPGRQQDLEEAVKLLMYGGRESYEHRNQLYRLLREHKIPDAERDDLGLPEWPRLIKLVRQLLDAPVDVSRSPLIVRELSLSYMGVALLRRRPQGVAVAGKA